MSDQPNRPRHQTTDDVMRSAAVGEYQKQQPRKKRKRIFMWTFLAIQALFLIWIIAGIASVHPEPTASDIANLCGNGQWQGVFTSYHDCVVHGAHGLTEAG